MINCEKYLLIKNEKISTERTGIYSAVIPLKKHIFDIMDRLVKVKTKYLLHLKPICIIVFQLL